MLYSQRLSRIDGITLPPEERWAKNVCWLYSILIDKSKFKIDRDGLIAELYAKGIDTRPFFHTIHTLPPYKTNICFSVAQRLSNEGINLLSSPNLLLNEIAYICNTINWIGHNARK